jgi:hypothetical protein
MEKKIQKKKKKKKQNKTQPSPGLKGYKRLN